MKDFLFFDNAATTRCCPEAVEAVRRFSEDCYGNPSSTHALGQQASRAIREARVFFASQFKTAPEQIIFTGSGTESDNMAVYGVALDALARRLSHADVQRPPIRVLTSAIEHPGVRKTAASLTSLGIDVQYIPVDGQGQIVMDRFAELLTPETVLVSIQAVNNIVGAALPIEKLAAFAKERVPHVVFHSDAVQAFGRIPVPSAPSPVDLLSVSGHKIEGPKGVGALIVLNPALLKQGLRPLIWGGGQENGFRSGTQSAGLISGFHKAAEQAVAKREAYSRHVAGLRAHFREALQGRGLLAPSSEAPSAKAPVRWNSPDAPGLHVPHIVNLSVPGFPPGPLAKLLEERRCIVSTGSACSSAKAEPDAVLQAMGLPSTVVNSAIRVSLSGCNEPKEIDALVAALDDSIRMMQQLLGGKPSR